MVKCKWVPIPMEEFIDLKVLKKPLKLVIGSTFGVYNLERHESISGKVLTYDMTFTDSKPRIARRIAVVSEIDKSRKDDFYGPYKIQEFYLRHRLLDTYTAGYKPGYYSGKNYQRAINWIKIDFNNKRYFQLTKKQFEIFKNNIPYRNYEIDKFNLERVLYKKD